MHLDEYMKELQKEWGIEESLLSDTPHVYEVPLEENLKFSIAPFSSSGIYLYSAVAPVLKGTEDKLFSDALYGNLFGEGTKNSVLGLNEQGDLLTLSRCIDYDISLKEFKEIIDDFISAIDFWRSKATESA